MIWDRLSSIGMYRGLWPAMDVANLAWKRAAVVHAGAPDDILDSYQEERAPHARAIIETAIAIGRVVCSPDVSKVLT